MRVRELEVGVADTRSAVTFFSALLQVYDLSEAKALDMFARTGALTVCNYAGKVHELHLWELGAEHKAALLGYMPTQLRIGCSYESAEQVSEKFDFVVVDSPQGAHKDYAGVVHYEHFDLVNFVLPKLLSDHSVVVLYVNKRPYNKDDVGSHGYDEYEDAYNYEAWMSARQEFYGSSVITEEQAVQAYRNVLNEAGFIVDSFIIVPCFSDVPGLQPYAFRVAFELERVGV